MSYRLVCVLAAGLAITECKGQCFSGAPPAQNFTYRVCGTAFGRILDTVSMRILEPAGATMQLDQVSYPLPDYLVITPSVFTIPAVVDIGPNPHAIVKMRPNRYSSTLLFRGVDKQGAAVTRGFFVSLDLLNEPIPIIQSVVNAASRSSVIVPGSIVSVLGTSLGPALMTTPYSSYGLHPTQWGNASVKFDGTEAQILYVSPERIDVVVPKSVMGQATTEVIVGTAASFRSSAPYSVPVTAAAPAVFTVGGDGSGQGDFQVFPGGLQNGPDNPAAPGATITVFATGEGIWSEANEDGSFLLTARSYTSRPVSLTIGGKEARIMYAGGAPYQAGRFQVNAILPADTPSGRQSVVLRVGEYDNAGQRVTMVVR